MYASTWFCLHVLYITRACLVPTVFRRGNQMASNWNYGQLQITTGCWENSKH